MHEGKKLSIWRVLLAVLVVGASGTFIYMRLNEKSQTTQATTTTSQKTWFGSYVDVSSMPTFRFEQLDPSVNRNVVLSFIVASKSDPCQPSWGAAYTSDQAASELDLDRRVARLRQNNIRLAISFGGLLNDELAVSCKDPSKLTAAYQQIIDRYKIDTVDFDLENTGLTNLEAGKRRAQVISALQSSRRKAGKNLAVWLTLPVAPQGLTQDGTNAVKTMLTEKVDVAGVNVMTFDYGNSLPEGQSVTQGSISALNETHRQLKILYKQAGITLSDETLWLKIGATPMIGQTDDRDQVFDLEGAKAINNFALNTKIGRVSMWSANRDIMCGENYVDTKKVSDSCSGVKQQKTDFAKLLANNIKGDIYTNASSVTKSEQQPNDMPDDPANSPYPIWDEDNAYPQGTKVVWHHNVYEAKWWNQDETPDNPVLQAWETPWQLVGPVLPGEKPVKQSKIPAGTYPNWIGETAYKEGDRVIFNDTPYQAKWWNQGESPAVASANPASSAWVALKQDEIQKVLEQLKQTQANKQ